MDLSGTKGTKVFVVGGGYAYIRMLWEMGFDGAATVEESDFVLFTGGEDVDPALYGEVCMAKTHYNRPRDEYEMGVYRRAVDQGKPMVGICRGGQFLNVMNGGKLYQHVNGHTGEHLVFLADPSDPDKRKGRPNFKATSTHHQMMIPTEDAIILLTALEATEKHVPGAIVEGKDKNNEDVEACYYIETNSLCFQPHPEFPNAPPELVDCFEEFLDNWIVPMIKRDTK